MKLQSWLVTGATGMIGQALVKALVDEGHTVQTLGRSAAIRPRFDPVCVVALAR